MLSLLVSIQSRHFLTPLIAEAVIVFSLNGLLLMHMLRIIRNRLVVHIVDDLRRQLRRWARWSFIGFTVEYLQWRVAAYWDTVISYYAHQGAQCILNQDIEMSYWEDIDDSMSNYARILLCERCILIDLYSSARIPVDSNGCFRYPL